MIRPRRFLPEVDRDVFQTTVAFAQKRLPERATLEWALSLNASDMAKRSALLDVLRYQRGQVLREPWRSTWRLVEESWESDYIESSQSVQSVERYELADRIRSGERSGALISSIVDLVRPLVKVSALSKLDLHYRRPPRIPRNVEDLLSVSLGSGELVDPMELGLDVIFESAFLLELAHGLDAALTKGIDTGRRLIDSSDDRPWRLGDLRRVYFVVEPHRNDGEDEPDRFNTGIAPSTKLLYAVLARLLDTEAPKAVGMIKQWGTAQDAVHVRLWAAFARDTRLATAGELGAFFRSASDRQFWDIHRFPEIAELRAVRFSDLDVADQQVVIRRLRRGPPAAHWPRKADRKLVASARRSWSVRELRRIELAGGQLKEPHLSWLANQLAEFSELRSMSRVDDGFLGTSKAFWVAPEPDERFDFLEGGARLDALEMALSSRRSHWENDPARRAADWIGAADNARRLVADFESVDGGRDYPIVWDRFGWQHSPSPSMVNEGSAQPHDPMADRVVALLERLPTKTAKEAIQGLTRWLDTWQARVGDRAALVRVWHRLLS
jgi:hypothetical protein